MSEWVNAVFSASIADQALWRCFREEELPRRFRLLKESPTKVLVGHTFAADARFGIPLSSLLRTAVTMLSQKSNGLMNVCRVDHVPVTDKRQLLLVLDGDGIITKPGDEGRHFTWEWMTDWLIRKRGRPDITTFRLELKAFLDTKRDVLGIREPHDELLWFETSVHCWKRLGLRREEIAECFASAEREEHLRPGLRQFLRWIRHERANVRVEVIVNSFGIADFFDILLDAEGVRNLVRSVYAARLVFDSQGVLAGYDPATRVLSANKGDVTREAMALLGMSGRDEDVIGLGDSVGDRFIAPIHRIQVAMTADQLLHQPSFFPKQIVAPSWADIVSLFEPLGL